MWITIYFCKIICLTDVSNFLSICGARIATDCLLNTNSKLWFIKRNDNDIVMIEIIKANHRANQQIWTKIQKLYSWKELILILISYVFIETIQKHIGWWTFDSRRLVDSERGSIETLQNKSESQKDTHYNWEMRRRKLLANLSILRRLTETGTDLGNSFVLFQNITIEGLRGFFNRTLHRQSTNIIANS